MRNRLLGLTLTLDTTPSGWTTIVLTGHHFTGQTIVLGSLRTNATLRPEVALEIIGPTMLEEAFFTLPTRGADGLRPEEN